MGKRTPGRGNSGTIWMEVETHLTGGKSVWCAQGASKEVCQKSKTGVNDVRPWQSNIDVDI